ncbi:MAG: SH3 domain-containing protein [Anaerolineae bacterium]|nr:SH3 domain-containing protein [Anaerolineae bacterium]
MRHFLSRLVVVSIALVLVWSGINHLAPRVWAQDGGDNHIPPNEPVIVTLTPGQTVTRTFTVLAGDGFELRLSRLAEFTYTAVLIDPQQAALPLTPGADGNIAHLVDTAPSGGVYSLVLQAAGGTGDMLIQLITTATPPVPLVVGEMRVNVTNIAQRYDLAANPAQTTLVLDTIAAGVVPAPGLPAIKLVNADTGETVLELVPGMLPRISVVLPANTAFLLALEPGDGLSDVIITWSTAPVSSDSSAVPANSSSSQTSGSCQIAFSGPVNIRSGPGTNYPVYGSAYDGLTLPVIGRNTSNTWWQVNYNGLPSWVAGTVEATTVQGDCSAVPYVNAPPPPAGSDGPYTPTYTPQYEYTPTYTPEYEYTPTYTPEYEYTPTYTQEYEYTPTYTQQYQYTATYTPSYTPQPPALYTLTPTP